MRDFLFQGVISDYTVGGGGGVTWLWMVWDWLVHPLLEVTSALFGCWNTAPFMPERFSKIFKDLSKKYIPTLSVFWAGNVIKIMFYRYVILLWYCNSVILQ